MVNTNNLASPSVSKNFQARNINTEERRYNGKYFKLDVT